MELKEEEMIKLPIALVEHSGWETAVDEAIQRRADLEKEAAGEDEYIRPILLFQAQNKDKEVTVEVLKKYLLETSSIPESQIKIATGEQKELDGIDIFNADEPTRYIITVEALKEGWDCSFAYVLCSLANVKSDTSVEQLLGRVMRMPYAKTRKNPALNKAYAYVVSPHFGEAAAALTEKLINKGFDNEEAQSTIQQEPPKVPDLNPNWSTPFNQYKVSGKLKPADVPAAIQFEKGDTLFFTPETSDEDIKKLCEKLPLKDVQDLIWKFENYKKTDTTPSPASQGIRFTVPRLVFEAPYSGAAQGEVLFADPDTIFETFDWNIGKYAEPCLAENEFNIGETGKGYFIILLNQGKKVETLKVDIASAEQFLAWKRMSREGKPTVLGMLVCGKHYEYFLEERCELDAYFETRINKTIADDKKIYKDNIIQLMQNALAFVYNKIGTGISVENGGTVVLEYPEEVIRETINNALAHRDYTQNRFSTLVVKNNEAIVISNPGKFRQEQMFAAEIPVRLRRIIPIPKAQNPHLADILKIYNRWEGRGLGMSSLVNYALNNEIDVPFFLFSTPNEICLTISRGKVFDQKCELWLNSFNKYLAEKTEGTGLSSEQKSVLAYFYKCEELNERERWTINLTQGNNHFNAISDLEKWGLVYRLPQSSPELPLYGIDPVLKKNSFHAELRAIFGDAYIALNNDYKEVLNAVYHHNLYSAVSEVSASLVCQFLYFRRNRAETDIKEFENYRRKIRYIINQLEKGEYIRRKESRKHDYEINKVLDSTAKQL